jgi:uncharacterized membrane protein YphA (DoxX/SURF4 family)
MNFLTNIARIIVGLLFIFSGLVKANDPLGLGYKMQEFFELWNMTRFNTYSLGLSIIIIAFEIIAGFALLLGWRIRLFSWLLLLLTIFFTFLTGYAYFSGKFKNCGCFGDCIPLTPRVSFIKDLVLLGLTMFLFANRRRIEPFFSEKVNIILMLLITFLSIGLQFYVLNYLPLVDCLPYKEGNNISEKRKPPPDAKPDVYDTKMIYHKNGKKYEFSASELPADWQTYTYDTTITKLVKKGNMEPAINGFYLSGRSNIDSTEYVLSQPACLLLFIESFTNPLSKWQQDFEEVNNLARQKNIPVFLVTASIDEAEKMLAGTSLAGLQIFKCDFTAIRTAARANPTLYFLKLGTIESKWSYREFDNAYKHIKKVPPQQAPKQQIPVQNSDTLPSKQ